jgi:hypothetical protein
VTYWGKIPRTIKISDIAYHHLREVREIYSPTSSLECIASMIITEYRNKKMEEKNVKGVLVNGPGNCAGNGKPDGFPGHDI